MVDDPFEQARLAMDRARRAFKERTAAARAELEQAARHFRVDIAAERERLEAAAAAARRGYGSERRRRPGPWWNRGTGRPGLEPEPSPLRPTSPSNLSGGAEAPLDP